MSKSLDDSFIERVLRDKDLQKLSSVLNVDLEELRHMNDLCLLNYDYAREYCRRGMELAENASDGPY